MSDFGDTGYDGGDVDFGHVEMGQEHGELDQLHQASGSDYDYNNDFNVYEQDTASAESTDFVQAHNVEFTDGHGASYSEQDLTSYSHDEASADHIFAADGSTSVSSNEFNELDALRQQFDTAFASGTEFHGDSDALGVAAN